MKRKKSKCSKKSIRSRKIITTVPSSQSEAWEQKHQDALEKLVDSLTNPPIRAYPDYSLPYVLPTDASKQELGTVLYQKQVGNMRVIAYASRTLTPAKPNYHLHSSKLEFLTLEWAVAEQF